METQLLFVIHLELSQFFRSLLENLEEAINQSFDTFWAREVLLAQGPREFYVDLNDFFAYLGHFGVEVVLLFGKRINILLILLNLELELR